MYEFEPDGKLAYLKKVITVGFIITGAYAAAYFCIGEPFYIPGGNVWAVFLVWVCGHIGGFIAVQCRIPALMGMLIMGLALQNLPGEILRGYKHSWESKIKAFGLATILMRAGLKINYMKAFLESGWTVVLLGLVPVISEGFIDLLIFNQVYKMPFTLAGTGGFLLSAISPTVVVTGMLDLQKRGFGVGKSIPSIEMAAAGVDVIVGIAIFSIFMSLAIQDISGVDDPWRLARGATSVGTGILASIIGGTICGCTKIFSTPTARAAVVFTLGQLFMFIHYHYGMPGGGALAAIGTAGCAAMCWLFGFPGILSLGRSDAYRINVDSQIAIFWMYVMQPLLFCTIGVSINFDNISASVLPKAIIVIFVGSAVRIITACLSTVPANLSTREALFVGLSWIPKATVQGALSAAPLDAILNAVPETSPKYDEYVTFGYDILATAVLSIFVTAPIGLLVINMLGPKLLTKEELPLAGNEAYTTTRLSLKPSHQREIEVVMDQAALEHVQSTETQREHILGLTMDQVRKNHRDESTQVEPNLIDGAMLTPTASGHLDRSVLAHAVTARRYKSLLHQELGILDTSAMGTACAPASVRVSLDTHLLEGQVPSTQASLQPQGSAAMECEGDSNHPGHSPFHPAASVAWGGLSRQGTTADPSDLLTHRGHRAADPSDC